MRCLTWPKRSLMLNEQKAELQLQFRFFGVSMMVGIKHWYQTKFGKSRIRRGSVAYAEKNRSDQ